MCWKSVGFFLWHLPGPEMDLVAYCRFRLSDTRQPTDACGGHWCLPRLRSCWPRKQKITHDLYQQKKSDILQIPFSYARSFLKSSWPMFLCQKYENGSCSKISYLSEILTRAILETTVPMKSYLMLKISDTNSLTLPWAEKHFDKQKDYDMIIILLSVNMSLCQANSNEKHLLDKHSCIRFNKILDKVFINYIV